MALTDQRLASLSRQYKIEQNKEKEAETKKKSIGAKIIRELDRRRARTLELVGVKVTKVAPTETRYDFEKLEALVGRQVARRVQKREVDKDLMAHEIQAGRLDPAVVAQCTYEFTKSAYVSVS